MVQKAVCKFPAGLQARSGTKQLSVFVTTLSRVLDMFAGLCMVAIMTLVVSNIILRTVFNQPILGTYEYVGFLTALVIGLALANCAVQNGHIAVDFVVERFSAKAQATTDIVINSVSLGFWCLASWQLWVYAASTVDKGLVSQTTQTPLYPFIYLVSLGFFALCLVILVKLFDSIKRAVS